MKSNLKYFSKSKFLTVDNFFEKVLFDKKIGYYNTLNPFGAKGDFITSPNISNLFSEMIAIWIMSVWEKYEKPKNFNIVELGPGEGSLTKVLLKVFRRFPEFNKAKKIYLFEKSKLMREKQKENIEPGKVHWINDFKKIRQGPVLFFGNEFLDAIPIKQFRRINNNLFEKYFSLTKNYKIKESYKKASNRDIKIIERFKCLQKLNFIEFPKKGLSELHKAIVQINKYTGCILLIDYGYLKSNNQNTLQSVMKHKKNNILRNLGKADVTSHVNFNLLEEFFIQNKLKVKKTITQKEFLEKMGIIQRAESIARNMKFREQSNIYLRLKRLLSPRLMGSLFKVVLAYKYKSNNNSL